MDRYTALIGTTQAPVDRSAVRKRRLNLALAITSAFALGFVTALPGTQWAVVLLAGPVLGYVLVDLWNGARGD